MDDRRSVFWLIRSHTKVHQADKSDFKAIYLVNSLERLNYSLNYKDYVEPNKVAMNDG
jgi:hypothetical protein